MNKLFSILPLMFLLSSTSAYSDEYKDVNIKSQQVSKHVYMLTGKGGNIGISAGEDGIIMIDDQFAPLSKKIKHAIQKISKAPIKFTINTHWHFDHVSGNANFANQGAIIVAHENVRKRMETKQFITFFKKEIKPYPTSALPVITFTHDISFHMNGDDIDVLHIEDAHTDSDSVIFFKSENVLHTGDIYFSQMYPFIDTSSHGSVAGMIRAVRYLLTRIDDNTKIIPGHGPLSNKAEFTEYLHMLENVSGQVKTLLKQGHSSQQIQQAHITKAYDQKWGNGFLKPNQFVQILVDDLTNVIHNK